MPAPPVLAKADRRSPRTGRHTTDGRWLGVPTTGVPDSMRLYEESRGVGGLPGAGRRLAVAGRHLLPVFRGV